MYYSTLVMYPISTTTSLLPYLDNKIYKWVRIIGIGGYAI
jgi:hypothetical protein